MERKMKRRMLVPIGALVLASAATSVALAQMPMGQGMMGCPMMGMMDQSQMDGGMAGSGMPAMMGQGMMGSGSMAAMLEGRVAYLKTELGITEAQGAAWKEYVDALKSRMSGMQSMRQEMMGAMQSGTALDRVKTRTKMMEGMVANMKALTPALESLYKVLTDEQKRKADQLLGMGMM
jgi:hypothetical protein